MPDGECGILTWNATYPVLAGGLELKNDEIRLVAGAKPLCNRNGVPGKSGSGSVCDAAWQGKKCTELALLPALGNTLGTIYPGRNSTTKSSWGGTVTKGADGMYHVLVSEMLEGSWQHNSVIRHAVTPTIDGVIDGVYEPTEQVLGVFAHNAACMDARPSGGPASDLLHIGTGTHDAMSHPILSDCKGAYSPPPPPPLSAATTAGAAEQPAAPRPPVMTPVMQSCSPGEPWTTHATVTCAPDAAGSTACAFDNPSG